jgi:hypothetical protein
MTRIYLESHDFLLQGRVAESELLEEEPILELFPIIGFYSNNRGLLLSGIPNADSPIPNFKLCLVVKIVSPRDTSKYPKDCYFIFNSLISSVILINP